MEAIKVKFSFRILLSLLMVVALLTLMMPRKGIFKYTYQKGSAWNYETLVAPFDFPILKTQEELRAEKNLRDRLACTPCYRYSEPVWFDVSRKLDDSLLTEFLTERYTRGIYAKDDEQALKADYPLNQHVLFLLHGKNMTKKPFSELYELGKVRSDCRELLSGRQTDSSITAADIDALLSVIEPNVLFDRQLTDTKNAETKEDVSVTLGVFKAGDVIVRTGDTITSSDERILDSYKAEFDKKIGYDGPVFLLWLGDLFLAVIMTLSLLLVTIMARSGIMDHFNEFAFVLVLFLLSAAVIFTLSRIDMADKLYLVPFPVFALYLVSFFRNKLVMPVYMMCLVPMLIACADGMRLFLMFLFAGCVAVVIFSRLNRGWHQFLAALFIFLSLVFVGAAFELVDGTLSTVRWSDTLYMLLGSLFVVLTYPLVYLFEIIFNLVSDSRLAELSDTNNKLLRELGRKAPGTFQHSIAVMNMADYVGRRMKVDVQLLRAGALYHDVGKIANPMCFVENQVSGVDFHSKLTPKQSAAEIIRHVTDGIALAEKYRVPKVIRDFISTHHGTTSTGYFHTKYLNEGGDPSDVAGFFYPGPAPRTREQVVLMLCDTVEAASRTLSGFDAQTVSAFVDRIYASKMEAGQFNGAEITLAELENLKNNLKEYMVRLHHGRIEYPERINK